MSEFQKSSLTAYGASRVLGTNVGETMTFTSIGLGSGIPPLDNLYNITQLEDERQRFPISERAINGDRFSASCHVTSVEHPSGIYLREMGLYIADKDFPNDPAKDKLFAVTCVDDSDTGANYVVFLPKSSKTTLIDYTFTIHTIISPSAEIVIKGLDPGTADFRLKPASPTVLGGLISSPTPGKISVNPDTGEATANELDRALNFIDSYTPYSLPVASESSLGGLKSGVASGTVNVNDTTHIGEVIGFQALIETVAMLEGIQQEIGHLQQELVAGTIIPPATLASPGIVQLSNTISPIETAALTPKALNDFKAAISSGTNLPLASVENAGIVQLEANFTGSSVIKAASAKALNNLYALMLSEITRLSGELSSLATSLESIESPELPDNIVTLGSDGNVPIAQLPDASIESPGIVQLSNTISQDQTIAPTLKAVDDLRQSLEDIIANLIDRLDFIISQGGIAPTLIALSVTSLPSKSIYETNETFDPTGLIITGIFSDSSEQVIYPEIPPVDGQNGYILSPPDMSLAGNETITVVYKDITTSFDILVADPVPPPVITGIEITTPPTKTVYEINEILDLSGIIVNVVYSDGSKILLSYDAGGVTGYKSSSPVMSTAGNKTVTISYMPDSTNFTQTFTVEVQLGVNWDGAVNNATETNNSLLTVLGASTVQQAWEMAHERINADGLANYHGLGLGDYLDITAGLPAPLNIAWNASYINLRLYILGFNTFKGSQGNTKNHILWGFKHIPLTRQVNTSNTNVGGYPATALKTYLDGDFLTSLTAALGHPEYFYDVKRLVSTQGNTSSPTSTVMQAKLWLPNEKEVFGSATHGNDPDPQISIPMYVKDANHRIKNYNGSAHYWWEATPSGSGTAPFCIVYINGLAHYSGANGTYGVAPCFCQI